MLIDSHAHLDSKEYDADREAVIARALAAGVARWLNISDGLDSFERSCALAEKYPQAYVSLGIHPHSAAEADEKMFAELAAQVRRPKVVALGETGLDYYYDNAPREKQRELFERFLKLAQETGLPLVIHEREAEADFLRLIDKFFPKGARGVMHCFTGAWPFAQECLKRGFYISFSGIVTFKNAAALQDVAKQIPLDSLMVETDAPFLTPEPFRGKRNEPAFVVRTAEKIAELRGMPLEEIARHTTANAQKLFNLK